VLFQIGHADLRVQINIWEQALWPLHKDAFILARFGQFGK
jgi:hypothetical protein